VVAEAFGTAASAPGFEACFGELYAHYATPAAWRVFPDVLPALTALRAEGLRLAVVSNFDGRLPGLLADLGLAALLDTIVYSSRTASAKPDGRIFQEALSRVGVSPAQAMHVGDGEAEDVAGGRAAGLRAVLLDRHGREPHPDVITIASLAELPALALH
jgi:putative hydrolase of the HAD superfamily